MMTLFSLVFEPTRRSKACAAVGEATLSFIEDLVMQS
jgi:hypothetical protein